MSDITLTVRVTGNSLKDIHYQHDMVFRPEPGFHATLTSVSFFLSTLTSTHVHSSSNCTVHLIRVPSFNTKFPPTFAHQSHFYHSQEFNTLIHLIRSSRTTIPPLALALLKRAPPRPTATLTNAAGTKDMFSKIWYHRGRGYRRCLFLTH